MKKVLSLILFALAVSYGTASSQQTTVISKDTLGWYKIGEAKVDFKKDRDEITILGADQFKSIKLKIYNAPIDLKDLEIYFENGKKQDVKVNKLIQTAGESPVIDLEGGGERNLKKINFVYKTEPSNMDLKAYVEVWGLKTNSNKK
jgi:hypothetical protein